MTRSSKLGFLLTFNIILLSCTTPILGMMKDETEETQPPKTPAAPVSKNSLNQPPASPKKTIAYRSFTPEMADYNRLQNLKYLVQHHHQIHPISYMRNLSWQVDAMHVLKRFMRDRTRNAVPIWNLLAYMHRGLSLPDISEQFLQAFTQQLFPHLEDLPKQFMEIEKLEQEKSELHKMMEELPYKCARETFKKEAIDRLAKTNSSTTDPIDLELFLALSKTPVEDKLNAIKKCSLFTQEYKFEKSMQCVEGFIKETTSDFTHTAKARQDVKDKTQDLEKKVNVVDKFMAASPIGRLIGILYEYESLVEALKSLQVLKELKVVDWSSASYERRVLLQTVTLFGEALNNISTPLLLNRNQDILPFIPVIKFLRNVFEHPEDFEREKLDNLLKSSLATKIWDGIRNELIFLGGYLENRIKILQNIFTSTDNCEERLKEILSSPQVNNKEDTPGPSSVPKNFKELLKQAHWQDNGLRYIQWLRRYVYHPSYPLSDPDTESLQDLAKEVRKSEYNKPKPRGRTSSIEEVIRDIDELKSIVKSFSGRNALLKKLNSDVGMRLNLVHLTNQIFLRLNTMIEGHALTFYEKLSKSNKKLFEICFKDIRERRNFSTHDLWREDQRGLANLAQKIVHTLQPILTSLSKHAPLTLNEPTKKMWSEIYDMTLTPETLLQLVKEGADVNATDEHGELSLNYLVNQSSEYEDPLIGTFLECGALPNLHNTSGTYPIHLAAEDARYDIIEQLIKAGAIPDPRDEDGDTPEQLALRAGYEDVAAYMRGMEARFRGDKADKLHRNLHPMWFSEALLHPLTGRNPNMVNADGELPLVLSIEKSADEELEGTLRVVSSLMKGGAEINRQQPLDDQTPLIAVAQQSKHVELLIYLLKNGAETSYVDFYGWSALHHAAQQNKYDFINLLLDHKANPQQRDKDGRTALLVNLNRADGGDIKVVDLLLNRGADPNEMDDIVGGGLHYAVINNDFQIAKRFLQAGASPDMKNKAGISAVELPDISEEMRKFLLTYKALLN